MLLARQDHLGRLFQRLQLFAELPRDVLELLPRVQGRIGYINAPGGVPQLLIARDLLLRIG